MVLMPTDPKFVKGYYLKYSNILELTSENLTHTHTHKYVVMMSRTVFMLWS